MFVLKNCLTCIEVHKSCMVKPWTHKNNLMITAQWVSAPPVGYFPKEISARAIRWLWPCRTQGHRSDSPGARSFNCGCNVAASLVHYSLFSSRAHQNDFSVTNHNNEMELSQQILKASRGGQRKGAPPPQPPHFLVPGMHAQEFNLHKKCALSGRVRVWVELAGSDVQSQSVYFPVTYLKSLMLTKIKQQW